MGSHHWDSSGEMIRGWLDLGTREREANLTLSHTLPIVLPLYSDLTTRVPITHDPTLLRTSRFFFFQASLTPPFSHMSHPIFPRYHRHFFLAPSVEEGVKGHVSEDEARDALVGAAHPLGVEQYARLAHQTRGASRERRERSATARVANLLAHLEEGGETGDSRQQAVLAAFLGARRRL